MKIGCARIVRAAACACAALVLAGSVLKSSVARAAWPDRTITIIVPFPPGGPNDLLGRLLAAELAPNLGQNVIVENRAGAVGNIGLAAGARAAPDGYTLVVVTGVVLINPSVTKVAYDPLKDFAPIAYLGAAPNAIITRPASGITSVADLIAKAKANPGKITYATAGLGSVSQLAVELLERSSLDERVETLLELPVVAELANGARDEVVVRPWRGGFRLEVVVGRARREHLHRPGVGNTVFKTVDSHGFKIFEYL